METIKTIAITVAALAACPIAAWLWMAVSASQVFDHEDERRSFDDWEEMP